MLRNQVQYGEHEDVSVQKLYTQIQPSDWGMDEQYIHHWGNLFRNCEAEIQPLIHIIIPTTPLLYE